MDKLAIEKNAINKLLWKYVNGIMLWRLIMAIINNDFHDVLTGRHSVRRFDPSVKISHEEMTEMLKETITAPSACNLQAWKFVVVDTDEEKSCINIL